ncbi:MAG: peptidylprolyl isomerase [Desulfuromonadales bacterium]
MSKIVCLLVVLVTLAAPVLAQEQVVIATNRGDITVALDEDKAPVTVANFLAYVDAQHYNDTIFHRVIDDFMIQGGNFTVDMVAKQTRPPIKNEATNGLRNERGTIAMARTGVVDSATSQFFINLKDNAFLDHRDKTPRGYGYAVFGRVIDGMDVVDRIGASPTGTYQRFRDVPVEPVIIKSVQRLNRE